MNAIVTILFATIVATSAVRIRDCGGSAQVDFKSIQITGCTAKGRKCTFVKGQDATMSLPFMPDVPVPAVKAKVYGIIAGIPIPFSLPNDNACENSGLKCPLQPKLPQTYVASLPVSKTYPSISVDVQWILLDQAGNKLVCIRFPVQLK